MASGSIPKFRESTDYRLTEQNSGNCLIVNIHSEGLSLWKVKPSKYFGKETRIAGVTWALSFRNGKVQFRSDDGRLVEVRTAIPILANLFPVVFDHKPRYRSHEILDANHNFLHQIITMVEILGSEGWLKENMPEYFGILKHELDVQRRRLVQEVIDL